MKLSFSRLLRTLGSCSIISLRWLCIGAISLYRYSGIRLIKLMLTGSPHTCRFYPSCSLYGMQAIRKYGPFTGTRLTLQRILKCHPWHEGGLDLVP